jgi:hypothetical protein
MKQEHAVIFKYSLNICICILAWNGQRSQNLQRFKTCANMHRKNWPVNELKIFLEIFSFIWTKLGKNKYLAYIELRVLFNISPSFQNFAIKTG